MGNIETDKYYTPSIEDLIEGYIFEAQVYDADEDEYLDRWEQCRFNTGVGLGHDLTHQFHEGTVRTPYLTPEQLESEGWNVTEPHSAYIILEREIDEFSKYEMLLSLPDHEVDISYLYYSPDVNYAIDETIFKGKCPSINEFRYISKLLRT